MLICYVYGMFTLVTSRIPTFLLGNKFCEAIKFIYTPKTKIRGMN